MRGCILSLINHQDPDQAAMLAIPVTAIRLDVTELKRREILHQTGKTRQAGSTR